MYVVFSEFGGDDDAVYTTEIKDQKIKSVSRERSKSRGTFYFTFNCYRFRLTGCNLITKYCITILYSVYTSQTSSGKCDDSVVSCPDFYCIFPPSLLFPSYIAAASVVFVFPGT
jgi:hypothetical protein